MNPATEAALALPEGVLRPVEPRDLDEPRGRMRGQAGLLAAPRSVEEVAAVVRACAAARVGIVPRGGGTGLVGGQVMADGPAPLVLTLERMAALRGVWPEEDVLIAEAGMTLAGVRAAAAAAGRVFPLALASQGSATIGGNLATNAGGTAVLRWGNARALCLGVEAVLPDGTILRGLTRLRKDNAGYDLRDLLIGAEGTLGVITAASLRLVHPAAEAVGWLTVDGPEAALRLLALAQGRFAGCVTGFELISGQGLAFLREVGPEVRLPPASDWAVLVQLSLPTGLEPEAAMLGLVEAAGPLVGDGVIAQSAAQAAALWAVREAIPEANRRVGAVASHDISLPLSEVPRFLVDAGRLVAGFGALRVNAFGHLGDGNLHYNVFPPRGGRREDYDAVRGRLSEAIHALVAERGGSVAAEHGVGRLKVGALDRWGDPGKLAAMRAVKAALDPLRIMNPGAVLA